MLIAVNSLADRFGDEVAARICRVVAAERLREPDVSTVKRNARVRVARLNVDRVLAEERWHEPHADARSRFGLRPLERLGASLAGPFGKAAQAASAR